MKDYSELKMLADAAILGSLEEGDNFRIKCRPSVIRGLFDDIERLGSRLCMCRDCGGQGEVYSGHSTNQGYNQPPEPDMDVCGTCGGDGVLGPVEDFEAITTERDQLKAEAEVLRKDAERYRWLRDSSNFGKKSDPMAISGYPNDISMLVCSQLDIEIDNRIERDSK